MSRVASVEEIRSHFPALERNHNGYPVAYFDGPGGTQVPRQVGEAVLDYLYHHNANTEWAYPTSNETDEMLAYARGAVADFLNASPEEIAFGANMTTLTLHLSRALGRQFSKGDEIVVTELDHHANIDPWMQLARDRDLVIRSVPMIPESGQVDWERFRGFINERTKVVAVGGASNALGTVNDICAATRLAHSAGAMVFIDAVHYAPHALVDVREIDCDFLACSAYKFNGPHVGVLYGKRDLLDAVDFPRLQPAHHNAPERAETGTLNHEGIVGAGAAVDFFASLSSDGGSRRERLETTFSEMHRRARTLVARMWNGLAGIAGVNLYGPTPDKPRTPTLAFTVDGSDARTVSMRLAERGVFVSHGDFYAMTVVNRLGLREQGLVRAGCGVYTSEQEVERLLAGVSEIAA
jgi:cysteine desulfurase family protein (TIGR01976 family)